MNNSVRDLLIESSKANRPVSYSEIAKRCGLNLNFESVGDRKILSNILGEISEFEHSNGRPLLSSMAMYQGLIDHGDGFYQICEELGFGSKKDLKSKEFAFEQMKMCFDYWSIQDAPDFFLEEEIDFFNIWGYRVYEPLVIEHVYAKEKLMATVWEKTGVLSSLITKNIGNYDYELKNVWHQKGWTDGDDKKQAARFKPYTWSKIFLFGEREKDIFFSVGFASYEKHFFIKLDFKKNGKSMLTKEQRVICEQFLAQNLIVERNLSFEDALSWKEVVEMCAKYIREHEAYYFELLDLVWNTSFAKVYESRSNVNYEAKNRNARILGAIGERLILDYEREKLSQIHPDKVKLVLPVKDYYGFDIISYSLDGNQIMIEVKTTTKSLLEPFYMSENQKKVSEDNPQKYFLYRVYDLDVTLTPPTYKLKILQISEEDLSFTPIEYQVSLNSTH